MTSDIKLEGGNVVLEGRKTISHTWDFILDSAERRLPNSDPKSERRALVHAPGDRLFINYGPDYKGGVIIGTEPGVPVRVEGEILAQSMHSTGQVQVDGELVATKLKAGGGEGNECTIGGRLIVNGQLQAERVPIIVDDVMFQLYEEAPLLEPSTLELPASEQNPDLIWPQAAESAVVVMQTIPERLFRSSLREVIRELQAEIAQLKQEIEALKQGR